MLILALSLCPDHGNSEEPFFSTLDKKPHLRVGISARKISVDFSLAPTNNLPFSTMPSMGMGLGDVGLYTAISGDITYENGSVGPNSLSQQNMPVPGMAQAVIDDAAQVTSTTGRLWATEPVEEVTFTTMSMMTINDSVNAAGGGASISDEQTAVGPYIDLVFPLVEEGNAFKNFVVGYRFYNTSLGFDPQVIGIHQASTFATTYTYQYDFIGALPIGASSFPFSSSFGTVFDATAFDNSVNDFDGGLLDPRQSSVTGNTFVNFVAISQTNIDLDLHEIPFGFECGRQLGKSTLSFNAGATLNIVELSMTSRTSWYQYGGRNLIYTRVSRQTDTPVKVGAYAGFNFTHPLNDDGSCYLNIHGSYRWVDNITASTGDIQASIDLSSWEGGIGIGFVFD